MKNEEAKQIEYEKLKKEKNELYLKLRDSLNLEQFNLFLDYDMVLWKIKLNRLGFIK